MSGENVQAARRGYAAWNRGDLDTMLATFHPDLEYVTSGLFPGLAPVYRGHRGWMQFWRDFRGPWDSLSIEVEEFRHAGEQVVVLFEFNATGRDGLEVDRRMANVLSFREGLAVRLEAYADWDAALEAAGLSSQGQNVDLVKHFYEHWSRGEIFALPELYADDVEFAWSSKLGSVGEGGVFHGREGGARAMLSWLEPWEDFRIHPDEFIAGEDSVVVPIHHEARSKTTGMPVEGRLVHAWTLRDGKVIRFHSYDELDEALEVIERSSE